MKDACYSRDRATRQLPLNKMSYIKPFFISDPLMGLLHTRGMASIMCLPLQEQGGEMFTQKVANFVNGLKTY